MATKQETFTEYLQRLAWDMRASAIDNDSPTADDLDLAAKTIAVLTGALRGLVGAYSGPVSVEFSNARSVLRKRPLGKKLS